MCSKTKTEADNWYATRLKQAPSPEPIKSGLLDVIGLKIPKGNDLMFMFSMANSWLNVELITSVSY